MIDVTVGDGKYKVKQMDDGNVCVYRYDDEVVEYQNSNVVHALAQEVQRLQLVESKYGELLEKVEQLGATMDHLEDKIEDMEYQAMGDDL